MSAFKYTWLVILAVVAPIVAVSPVGAAGSPLWSQETLPLAPGWSGAQLSGVSCVSATACTAVGSYTIGQGSPSLPLVATLVGSTWTYTALPPPAGASAAANLDAVSCTAPSACVAVGSAGGVGLVETLSGTSWTSTTTFETSDRPVPGLLLGVSCVSTIWCVAVGTTSSVAGTPSLVMLSGSTWTVQSPPLPAGNTGGEPEFTSVSCVTTTFCVAVGTSDAIETLTASTWALMTLPLPVGAVTVSPPSSPAAFRTVSCPSTSSCVAAGYYQSGYTGGLLVGPVYQTLVETLSGSGWSPSTPLFVSRLDALSCTSITSCVGVGNIFAPLVETNGQWSAVTLPPPNVGVNSFASAVSCTSSRCVVVGQATIFHANELTSMPLVDTPSNPTFVGMAASSNNDGYLLAATTGAVWNFGGSGFFGSMGSTPLDQPMVGMASTPDGKGYWEVAADGGIFSFGDAQFFGSMGGHRLDQPMVGMSADLATGGYWEVAADGGIFSFDAPYFGSTGGMHLNKPVTAMVSSPTGQGYRFLATDGGVFDFGDAVFFGSPA